jgi:hypothetical protein
VFILSVVLQVPLVTLSEAKGLVSLGAKPRCFTAFSMIVEAPVPLDSPYCCGASNVEARGVGVFVGVGVAVSSGSSVGVAVAASVVAVAAPVVAVAVAAPPGVLVAGTPVVTGPGVSVAA